MLWFRKSKKSRTPSKHPASLGIPAHVAIGPLGFGADLNFDVDPAGAFRSVACEPNIRRCSFDHLRFR